MFVRRSFKSALLSPSPFYLTKFNFLDRIMQKKIETGKQKRQLKEEGLKKKIGYFKKYITTE